MKMEKPNIKIYISCHKPSQIVTGDCFYPIQVGAALARKRMEGMLHDDVGDNISKKNPMYCELTAQYWAWKNDDADYYGFCHYRRYFSFSPETYPEDIYGSLNFDALGKHAIDTLKLSDSQRIRQTVVSADFLIGAPADFREIKEENLYTQYDSAPLLHGKDMRLVMDILKERCPEYGEAAEEYMHGHLFYPCNMFIMKKELFREYCGWLFPILEEAERRIDFQNYSVEAYRTIGHLSERLLGVFYTYLRKNRPQCRVKVLQRAIIHNTTPLVYPQPVAGEKTVPVFFNFGESYIPIAAASLRSLAENADPDRAYDITVLHRDITENGWKRLQSAVAGFPNMILRRVDISAIVEGYALPERFHITSETFFRLLAPELFREYRKILYLDADMIFLRDVGALYDFDLKDNLLAATLDADHVGQYCGGVPQVRKYTEEVLKLENPLAYFQAGVILMNLDALRAAFRPGELFSRAVERNDMYMDQDALNVMCQGRVAFLDPRWNVLTDCKGRRIRECIQFAPKRVFEAYQQSRRDPFVIHYAGEEKPWQNPQSDMAEYYWEYARKTSCYEILLARLCANPPLPPKPDFGVMGALKVYIRKHLNRIFPGKFPPDPNTPDIGVRGAIMAHFR